MPRKAKQIKKGGDGWYFGTPMIGKEPMVYSYNNKCDPVVDNPAVVKQPNQSGGEGYYLAPPMIEKEPEVHSYRPAPMSIPPKTGGGGRNNLQPFQQLYNKLKALSKTQLATLTILLTLKDTKKEDMPQHGGSALISTLLPFSKEMLIVLTALLLLQYYTKKNRKQFGGDNFTKRIIDVIEAKNSKKKMIIGGGFMLMDIQNIIAPYATIAPEAFLAAGLLVALQVLLQTGKKKNKQLGGAVRKAAIDALRPLNAEKFLASEGLVELAKAVRKAKKLRQQNGGLGNEQSEYGCQEEWGEYLDKCI